MALNTSTWLDEKLIYNCLQDQQENEEIVIKKFESSTVAAPGDSYLSFVRRVNIEYQKQNNKVTQHLSVIVKGPSLDEVSDFFLTEPKLYREFLPEAFKVSSNIGFAPKSYPSTNPYVVIMEDLKSEGYSMANRQKLLDFDHCRLYAIASATFHAVSVAVHGKHPDLVESLGIEKFFSNDLKSLGGLKRLFKSGLRYMANKMKHYDEYKKYVDVIHSSSSVIWDMAVEALKPNATFNALSQGDAWTANMMFKYDESGKVSDIKLLDFQGLRYSSPAGDLVFFLWTSANYEVLENRFEDFCHIYCDTLNARLEEYNCTERLMYEQLMENIMRLSSKALLVSAVSYPIIMCSVNVDIRSLLNDAECDESVITQVLDQCYNKNYCENHFPMILKQLEHSGVFSYVVTHLKM